MKQNKKDVTQKNNKRFVEVKEREIESTRKCNKQKKRKRNVISTMTWLYVIYLFVFVLLCFVTKNRTLRNTINYYNIQQ